MDDYIKSLLKDFFEEALDMIERLEENVLILEKDYNNTEAIQEIFRAVHTLKGSAGSVEMFDIQKYSHNFEDLLDLIRTNKVKVNRDTIDILLHASDTIKILVQNASNKKKYKGNLDKDILFLERFKEQNIVLEEVDTKKTKAKKTRKKKEEILEVSSSDNSTIVDKAEEKNKNIEIDEKIKLAIKENKNKDIKTYSLEISFNEKNPMRSVGSIQVFISLRDIADILMTTPTLEELEGNDFYKTVYFLISTKKSIEDIKDIVQIEDMTTSVKIEEYILEDNNSIYSAINVNSNDDNDNNTTEESKKDKAKEIDRQNAFLKVESDKIDAMMNQVGELVTNKSSYHQYDEAFNSFIKSFDDSINEIKKYHKDSITQILRHFESIADKHEVKEFKNNYLNGMNDIIKNINNTEELFRSTLSRYRSSYQLLTRVTSDLQETVMKIRMVAISQIFNRFTRLVRDLSRELEKEVELKIYGEETELDKSVIEILHDPILHLIRNSMDHGIESPHERVKLGKNKTAVLKLSASNEGNIIIIKISDDGAGVDTKKIFDSAVKKGLIQPDSKLTDKEIVDLIFIPGFSTASKVSNVSGRGVGMDVVKKSLEKINGSINIETEKNIGTTFTLKIPLTLAILQTLIVESEQEYYAIPINTIIETIKVEVSELDVLEGATVIKIRNEIISVISIKELFNLPDRNNNNSCYVVIISSEEKKIALLVNSLVGEQDIVIKALNDKIIKSEGIVGATILGDGTVSFILDIQAMISLGTKVLKDKEKQAEASTGSLQSFLNAVRGMNTKKMTDNNNNITEADSE